MVMGGGDAGETWKLRQAIAHPPEAICISDVKLYVQLQSYDIAYIFLRKVTL